MKSQWMWACVVLAWIGLSLSSASAEEAPGAGQDQSGSRLEGAGTRRGSGALSETLDGAGLSRGVDSIIAQIREREVLLASREQEVSERERAVAELEAVIDARSVELDRIRQEVEDRISGWAAQGQDRVAQLSDVYSSMPPVKAGQLLGNLELDLAVSIIRGMKKKGSAGVLAAMRPDRALLVSERMLKPLDPGTDAPAAMGQ